MAPLFSRGILTAPYSRSLLLIRVVGDFSLPASLFHFNYTPHAKHTTQAITDCATSITLKHGEPKPPVGTPRSNFTFSNPAAKSLHRRLRALARIRSAHPRECPDFSDTIRALTCTRGTQRRRNPNFSITFILDSMVASIPFASAYFSISTRQICLPHSPSTAPRSSITQVAHRLTYSELHNPAHFTDRSSLRHRRMSHLPRRLHHRALSAHHGHRRM